MKALVYFLLFLLLPYIGRLFQREIRARQSRDWPTTAGKITSARLKRVPGSGKLFRPLSRPYLEYEYTVEGDTYTSSTITWGTLPEAPAALIAHYPPGQSVPVYYHPQAPHLAVLAPGGSAIRAFLNQVVTPVLGLMVAVAVILVILTVMAGNPG